MKNLILKYFAILLAILFMVISNSCKKNTTSSDKGSNGGTEYPQINVKVADTNIPTGTGSYDFGEVNVGETSSAASFTIENLGDATLNLDGTPPVEISDSYSEMFPVAQQPGNMIDAGNTTSMNLTFNPTVEGDITATVYISSNDPNNNPYSFALNGTGIKPFILDYVGDWVGQWTNTTYHSAGEANLVVSADTEQKTIQFVIDVDGPVFGLTNPDPITLEGTYTDTEINVSTTVNTFGDLTLTIDDEGNISGSATNVPNPNIDRIDFTGTVTSETMTINYTVTFSPNIGGGIAVGVFTLNKVD